MEHQALDFTGKLMQPSMQKELNEYLTHKKLHAPVVIEFDPTSLCFYSCPNCVNSDLLNKKEFTQLQIESLFKDFSNMGVKAIIFIGGGEPLAHALMPLPITLCHDVGIDVGITTNGFLINKHLDVIADYAKWTRVSVDAASKKTYEIVRPVKYENAFTRVINNMEKLARVKKGKMGFSFLLTEFNAPDESITNASELFDAACLAKEIGCDYFEFKPSVNKHHHLIPLSLITKQILLEQIEQINALNDTSFKIIYPESMSHLLSNKSIQVKKYHSCPVMEFRTLVAPQGVYPCPYKRGNENYLLSDSSSNFKIFWESQDRIDKFTRIDPSKDCTHYCIRHSVNEWLISKVNGDNTEHITGVEFYDYFI